jgi:hypothetical protein
MATRIRSSRRRIWAVGLAVLLAVALSLTPTAQAGKPPSPSLTGQASAYSGDAAVVDVDATLLGTLVAGVHLVDAGPLASSGGSDAEELLHLSSPAPIALDASVGLATTLGSGQLATSFASVAALSLGVDAGLTSVADVSAGVIQATSRAECVNGSASLSGGANLVNASISVLGAPAIVLPINPGPNTTINVGGLATLTLNEQIVTPGSVTVNALHLSVNVPGVAAVDVILSHAHSDIACNGTQPPACPVKDFVTGGGYVVKDGSRVSFSVHGGLDKSGGFRPSGLNVVDHGTGQHIQSHGIDAYGDPSPTSTKRVLHFPDGNWTVSVADNGEPGRADTFQVAGPGYTAGSTSTAIGGGNLQLHLPKGCGETANPPKGRK